MWSACSLRIPYQNAGSISRYRGVLTARTRFERFISIDEVYPYGGSANDFCKQGGRTAEAKELHREFSVPREGVPRPRKILLIAGAKGVGKTSLMRMLIKQGVERTIFVYVEFSGSYESRRDMIVDLLSNYYESMRNIEHRRCIDAFKRILRAIGIKILGENVIDALTSPDHVKIIESSRPTLILKRLEEELCKECYDENVRLVTVYDEFQNFIKSIQTSGTRFHAMLESMLSYFSKTQEHGFNSGGYPIRILLTSDFSLQRGLLNLATTYLEIM